MKEREKEIWKDYKGYEGAYQASSHGRIRSLTRKSWNGHVWFTLKGRVLKLQKNSKGYLTVFLSKKGKVKTREVHVIIAEVFLNHKRNGHVIVVDHDDHNILNNYANNLKLVTKRKNSTKDRWRGNYTSKYIGVSWNKERSIWVAMIMINGKSKFLGRFVNETDAHYAYQNALKEHEAIS